MGIEDDSDEIEPIYNFKRLDNEELAKDRYFPTTRGDLFSIFREKAEKLPGIFQDVGVVPYSIRNRSGGLAIRLFMNVTPRDDAGAFEKSVLYLDFKVEDEIPLICDHKCYDGSLTKLRTQFLLCKRLSEIGLSSPKNRYEVNAVLRNINTDVRDWISQPTIDRKWVDFISEVEGKNHILVAPYTSYGVERQVLETLLFEELEKRGILNEKTIREIYKSGFEVSRCWEGKDPNFSNDLIISIRGNYDTPEMDRTVAGITRPAIKLTTMGKFDNKKIRDLTQAEGILTLAKILEENKVRYTFPLYNAGKDTLSGEYNLSCLVKDIRNVTERLVKEID